jgi:hypothetical protein
MTTSETASNSLATSVAVLLLAIAPCHVLADEVIVDDLIIDGSICVGLGCVADEEFGFDTVRLVSDNPLIRFQDTSTTASFPTQDWTMGMDDGASDTSVFFVKDAIADALVLQVSSSPSGGIALGAGAELVENAISVGSEGSERRIMHVAPGSDATDAVNVGQFDQFQAEIANQLEDISARIAALAARLDAL